MVSDPIDHLVGAAAGWGGLPFPAADVPHSQGLSFDEAMSALDVFIASRKFVALVITEFNAHREGDGMLARRFVEAVAKALEERGD